MKLDIEAMAREAGAFKERDETFGTAYEFEIPQLERFARLIVERCAQECEQTEDGEGPDCWDWHSKDYSKAIRNLLED